jgi:hypothetical protein
MCNNNANNCNALNSVNVNHVPYRVDGSSVCSNDHVDVRSPQIYGESNFIAPSDLTLPNFNDSTRINAMFHVRQLKEYMKL